MGQGGRREAGFTLLEVLVALVIAVLAMAVMFQGSLAGLRASQVAGQYEEALSLARSHLADVSQRASAQAVDAEGIDGPVFHYRIQVVQIGSEALQRSVLEGANNQAPRQANLFALSVTEYWITDGKRRQVALTGANMVVQKARS